MLSRRLPPSGHASQAMLLYVRLDRPVIYLSTLSNDEAAIVTLSWTNPMWQRLSLRARINLLLALVLALGLTVNIARLVLEAGPRVQAEDQSVIRLAREFIEMIVADLNEAPDPDAKLNQIARDLNRSRHVSIALRDTAGNAITPPRADADNIARVPPAWFVSLVHPEQTAI